MEIAMSLLLLLGGVGVFLYGMKTMGSGLEQNASAGVKNLFKRLNKNRFADYGIGIGVTALVQSSSATSIMTIGLANAGIVNDKQGAGIILGAKVGTTLTAFVFALGGLSNGGFSIGILFSSVAFVGVIIMLSTQSERLKKISLFLTGFGMLFLGLEVMQFSIGDSNSFLSEAISRLFEFEAMHNPVLLLLVGLVFTCVIQSSTAATGIFIAFLQSGVLKSVDQSFFLIMGANIGTCMDGIMASIGSNIHGKRMALFHLLSSTIGAVVFAVIVAIFQKPIVHLFDGMFGEQREWSLATFNLIYNAIYTLALLPLLNPLVAFVAKIIKDKPDDKVKLKYVDDRLLKTPSIAIEQTVREVLDMAHLARENINRAFDGLLTCDTSQSKVIADAEYQIDFTTKALVSFMIKISSASITFTDEKLIGGLHHVISDIERIGDHAVNYAKETNILKQQGLTFSQETTEELATIWQKITQIFDMSLETFKTRKIAKLAAISELQLTVNELTSNARETHIAQLNSGQCSVEVTKSLYTVLLSLQRIADHLVNVAFSIRSSTGSKTETFENLSKSPKGKPIKSKK